MFHENVPIASYVPIACLEVSSGGSDDVIS